MAAAARLTAAGGQEYKPDLWLACSIGDQKIKQN
jgi:hypothetical protein